MDEHATYRLRETQEHDFVFISSCLDRELEKGRSLISVHTVKIQHKTGTTFITTPLQLATLRYKIPRVDYLSDFLCS